MKHAVAVAALAGFFLLTSCAHDQTPVVVTKEVKVAVPVPCKIDDHKQRPKLLTLAELQDALAKAPNVDSKALLISSQLLLYMGWLPVVEGALEGCKLVPGSGGVS